MTNKEKFILLRKGIETAKELQDKATEAEDLIFKALDDLGVDSAKHNTAAENLPDTACAHAAAAARPRAREASRRR